MDLIKEANDSKYVRRMCDQSNSYHDVETENICNTKVLKSNLCDYNDVYILVQGNITTARNIAARVLMDQQYMMLKTRIW